MAFGIGSIPQSPTAGGASPFAGALPGQSSPFGGGLPGQSSPFMAGPQATPQTGQPGEMSPEQLTQILMQLMQGQGPQDSAEQSPEAQQAAPPAGGPAGGEGKGGIDPGQMMDMVKGLAESFGKSGGGGEQTGTPTAGGADKPGAAKPSSATRGVASKAKSASKPSASKPASSKPIGAKAAPKLGR